MEFVVPEVEFDVECPWSDVLYEGSAVDRSDGIAREVAHGQVFVILIGEKGIQAAQL